MPWIFDNLATENPRPGGLVNEIVGHWMLGRQRHSVIMLYILCPTVLQVVSQLSTGRRTVNVLP